MEHSITFCSRNYRTPCSYCEMLATRCKCTSQRRNLMAIVHKMITDCKSFDLHNNVHRLISHIYSIYKMQIVSEKIDEIISTGEYGEKELDPIPLTDIHFWEGVQSHTEDGNESLHIIQQASCGINNTIPFNYMMNSIDEIGYGLEITLTKWYSEAPTR